MKNTPKTTQELPQDVCKVCTDCIEEFCRQGTSDFCLQCTDINKYVLSQQQSLLDRVNLEIIGDKEYYHEHYPFVRSPEVQKEADEKRARDELREDQRKKLEEVRKNL